MKALKVYLKNIAIHYFRIMIVSIISIIILNLSVILISGDLTHINELMNDLKIFYLETLFLINFLFLLFGVAVTIIDREELNYKIKNKDYEQK